MTTNKAIDVKIIKVRGNENVEVTIYGLKNLISFKEAVKLAEMIEANIQDYNRHKKPSKPSKFTGPHVEKDEEPCVFCNLGGTDTVHMNQPAHIDCIQKAGEWRTACFT